MDQLDNPDFLSDEHTAPETPIPEIPVPEISFTEIPLDPPVGEAPAPAPAAESVYRNVGSGRKESPFANSPYESAAPRESTAKKQAPVSPDASGTSRDAQPDKPRKAPSGLWKKILAAAGALALVIGSCAVTAGIVNRRWEERTARMELDLENRLIQVQMQLQDQIASQSGTAGISTSGTGTADGLTPTQVYARNVNSVVAVSNYAVISDRWYGTSGEQLAGTGSGFIISGDGYIMTNYHVIEDASRITITTHSGEEYEAALIGSDQINDVALLKVDATGLDPVEIGSSDDLLVGDMVIAIGNPLGELTATATVGYVSGKDRSVSTDGTIINMLQTDAAINSGNSGGPLFNMKGQVIGITTAKYSGSTGSGASIEGIGFAIPINDVTGMIDDFKNYGYLRNQAYLGVTVINTDSTTAQMYNLPNGSYVQSVVEGGCAEKAGILPQDIIIAVGEYPVDGNNSLTSALRRFSAGDTTTITVFRSGAEVELTITFDERPQNAGAESTEPLEEGEMPDTGSFDEWYDYFDRYFGFGGQ